MKLKFPPCEKKNPEAEIRMVGQAMQCLTEMIKLLLAADVYMRVYMPGFHV